MLLKIINQIIENREKSLILRSEILPSEAPLPNISELPKPFIVALNEVGIKEFEGEHHNPRIVEYHQSCDLKAKSDEIAWCSAFVNWCFMKSGMENRTKSAAAISWRNWGELTDEPKVGDIAVFRRVGSSWRGHVGFFVAEDEHRVLILGGNQGNKVSFQWYPKQGKSIYLFQFRK